MPTVVKKKKKKTPAARVKVNGDRQVLDEKWTIKVIQAGYTVLPSILLERQRALGLDAIDVNILLHIIKHWWDPDERPIPVNGRLRPVWGFMNGRFNEGSHKWRWGD